MENTSSHVQDMVMGSRRKGIAYHHKLLFLLLFFSWTLVSCCLIFQHRRETHFKAEQLNARLQLFNIQLMDALNDGISPDKFIAGSKLPFPDLRISIIDRQGKVAFDNSLDTLPATNHLNRTEIADAIEQGSGYTIRRHSESNNETYFYSAISDGEIVIRSAVPYSSVSLAELLAADQNFIWFMLGVTIPLSIFAYFVTRRLGHNIIRLNRFAEKAEQGERIYADEAFPNDELGEISSHIIRLYARMQQAITERDRQYELALHQEQEKIRIKKQLTNNINHELKTPVASMLVCLETLIEHPDITQEKRIHFINKCYDNAERLKHLLDDVATITRLDDGTCQIAMETVVIKEILDELINDMEFHPAEKQMKIHSDLPDTVKICGNHAMITSIFRNLMSNALSYSGGDNIYIHLAGETPEHYRISFADDGNGVDEKHLSHLFERFYRVDKGRSRKLGGTGLGLAIVKNAVLFHHGSICARNQQNGGLEFEFTLHK